MNMNLVELLRDVVRERGHGSEKLMLETNVSAEVIDKLECDDIHSIKYKELNNDHLYRIFYYNPSSNPMPKRT